jgi:hypothetical protein
MSDVLLERIAVALEKIAGGQSACAVDTSKRSRSKKEEIAAPAVTEEIAEPAVAEVVVRAAPAQVAGFLDDEEPEAAVVVEQPVLTEREQRDEIRKQMIALQKIIGPDKALSLLVKVGGSETLVGLKPEKFEAVRKAIKAALPA